MRTLILLVLGGGVLVASGAVNGVWTDRWRVSPQLEQAVSRVDSAPLVVGEWRGKSEEFDAEQVKAARIAGYCYRRYENRKGQQVAMLLVCGRGGPISVHPPDVCYKGSGFEAAADPVPFTLQAPAPAGKATLRTTIFRKDGVDGPAQLRIFWGWNATGEWVAPAVPRGDLARRKALYKLYVVREVGAKDAPAPENDPAVDFLKAFLPELNRSLFPAS